MLHPSRVIPKLLRCFLGWRSNVVSKDPSEPEPSGSIHRSIHPSLVFLRLHLRETPLWAGGGGQPSLGHKNGLGKSICTFWEHLSPPPHPAEIWGVSKRDKHGAVTSRSCLHKTPPVSRAFLSLMWKTSPQEPQDGETRKSSVKPARLGQALDKGGWKRPLRVSKWGIDDQDVT